MVKTHQEQKRTTWYHVRQAEGALAQATVPVLRAGLDTAINALDVMPGILPGTHRRQLALP